MTNEKENCGEGNAGSSMEGLDGSVNGAMERRRDFINPVKKARRYQLEVLTKALEENTIIFLETGCGKTLIAVLLIHAFRRRILKPSCKIAVFLAPNRALVDQQAKEIEDHTDLHVGRFWGSMPGDNWDYSRWRGQIIKYEVIVMTPQILFNNLHHVFFTMEMIELLIFDECHHAQKKHPYANIMRDFYHSQSTHRPKIFGMTASPIIGKVNGGGVQRIDDNLVSLESMLDARVYTLRDRAELENLLPNPLEQIRMYESSLTNDSVCELSGKLRSLGSKFLMSNEDVYNFNGEVAYKKQREEVQAAYRRLVYCLFELGPWCTKKAAKLLIDKEGQCYEDGMGDCKQRFLQEALQVLSTEAMENDGELSSDSALLSTRWMSSKLLCLIQILLDFRENFQKCIIFVDRVIATEVVANLLNSLPSMSFLRCLPLVGSQSMSQKLQQQTIEKFRAGVVNLLVATDIAEEGLDIQSCFMVIRFDAPKQNRSYIQSRGRARKQGSHYIVLVERGNVEQLGNVVKLRENEKLMWELTANRWDAPHTLKEPENFDVEVFTVESTGATVTTDYSVPLLHHYCSKLPGDKFYYPKPEFEYFEVRGGVECQVRLPLTAAVKVVRGHVCPTSKLAKRVAAFECCKKLHEVGALTDFLLPVELEQRSLDESSDPTKKDTMMELHPALIPKALRGDWAGASSDVRLRAYSFHITAEPQDREYAHYALFLGEVLDECVTSNATELHLTKGRVAKVQLVPGGVVIFTGNQLKEAQLFQERILSIMLDHNTEQKMPRNLSSPTQAYWDPRRLYLLLPVVPGSSSSLRVDWASIDNLLSDIPSDGRASIPDHCEKKHIEEKPEGWNCWSPPRSCGTFQMADGPAAAERVVNSLVETVYNGRLYCTVDVLWDMNGASHFVGNPQFRTYTDYFKKRYGLDLQHQKQPLLKAKPLMSVHNLIVKRLDKEKGVGTKEEMLVELPPEVCKVKVLGLTRESVNTLSLLPSIMHRLEYLLIASELQKILVDAFSEASKVSFMTVFQALTTATCLESLNLERLEFFGDSFLKFAVSKRLFLVHERDQEGQLTDMRIREISNSNLHQLGIAKEMPLYIHDEKFQPCDWAVPGRPSRFPCDANTSAAIHALHDGMDMSKVNQIKCSEGHRWLQRKTVADVVEALIGAHLVEGGPDAALAFMNWMGIKVEFDPELIAQASAHCGGDIRSIQVIDLSKLEGLLGYTFKNKALLVEALTHSSYQAPSGTCYQRLEFLGDAVLDYLITCHLYAAFPDLPPGHLTDLRSATTNNEFYARVSVRNNLQSYILHDSSFLQEAVRKFVSLMDAISQGREPFYGWDCNQVPKVLGDLVESLAGAVFVDTGFDSDSVWEVFEPLLQPIVTPDTLQLHPVRELTELCRRQKLEGDFDCIIKGNLKVMTCTVLARDLPIAKTEATKGDKKGAKRLAAYRALEELKKQGFEHPYRTLATTLVSQGRIRQRKPALESDDAPALNKSNDGIDEYVPLRPSGCNAQGIFDSNLSSKAALEQILEAAERDKQVLQELGEEFRVKLAVEPDASRLEPLYSLSQVGDVDGTLSAMDSFTQWEELDRAGTADCCSALPVTSGSADSYAGREPNDLLQNSQKKEASLHFKAVPQTSPSSSKDSLPDEMSCSSSSLSEVERCVPGEVETSVASRNNCSLTDDITMAEERARDGGDFWIGQGYISQEKQLKGTSSTSAIPAIFKIDERHFRPGYQNSHAADGTMWYNYPVGELITAQPLEERELPPIIPTVPQSGIPAARRGFMTGEFIWDTSTQNLFSASSAPHGLVSSGWIPKANFDETVGRAREELNIICAKHQWAAPVYALKEMDGPPHNPRFTYIVIVKISTRCLEVEIECEGEPMANKKRAMDSAAEQAIAWIRQEAL